jgi:1-acyl-sn-glycerol-3-phosphate acyltransferase
MLPDMLGALLTAYTLLELGVCMVIWVPLLGAVRLRHGRDPARRVTGRWLRRFGRTTTRLSPLWRISIDGQVPDDISHRAYVVVANHQSNLDPFLLSHLPWDMRWIAKQELFRIPVIGSLLRLSGDIPLRRGDSESVRRMVAECRETLDRGLSVMMFPEGTRSRDGSLGAFKDGAFRIAIEAQVPVLPIAIEGTREGLPAGGWRLGKVRARARVLQPVPTAGLGPADVEWLRDTVRTRIASAF